MTQEKIEVRVLTASEGFVLTNGETYSDKVYLGINDSAENWREIRSEDLPVMKEPAAGGEE